MRLGLRQKLVLGGLAIVLVVSFGFTLLQLTLVRHSVEEDLQARAVFFAREVAASIGDRRELQGGARLERQIKQIMSVRRSVLQLDIIAFGDEDAHVVATSHQVHRLPFTRADAEQVRLGRIVSRRVADERGRYWEVMAPVSVDEAVAGAVAVKFSFDRADALAARTRNWALVLTAASVAVMGVLMTAAVHLVVNRPIQRFLGAIRRVQEGDQTAVVRLQTNDEFGVLADHFNEMMARLRSFNEELQARVAEATTRADERYREVERLHGALFRMQRNLSHAERLALAGQIMAEVAHEVGTPLQSVAGHVQLLQKDLPPEVLREPVTRHLGIIQSQLARVTEIITQLLGMTRRHPGEPGPVDLNRLVGDTAELLRPGLTAAGVTLEIKPTPGIPAVWGHPSRLQQVVLNLFTNAMDATAPGGTMRGHHAARRRRCRRRAGSRRFRPGHPGRRSQAHLRAVLLDQEIRPRNGARTVHLGSDRPRAPGPHRRGQRSGSREHLRGPAPRRRRSGMKAAPVLLVADDDPVVREFLAEVLRRDGYRVCAVSGGEECVQRAASESFDLALVDLRMPDLGGIEVLKRLATLQPAMPVLILTAFVTMETAIEAIQAGAWDYLSKPLRVEEIEVTVRRAAGGPAARPGEPPVPRGAARALPRRELRRPGPGDAGHL